MKPHLSLLTVLVVLLLLGMNVMGVRADRPQVSNNQSGAFVYYFPLVSRQLASCSAAPLPPIDWDPRLGTGPYALQLLDKVRIIPAVVAPCQQFWRVVVVKFEDINESGNDHTIYVKVLDENGNRAGGQILHVIGESSGLSEYPDEKPAGDMCNCNFNYPMYGDAYSVHIDGALPSDTMAGMIMPMRRHVNYRITFQRVWNPM